jgi:hypothetical protein
MRFHQLKRREFITLLGGAAAFPLAARAQSPKRLGVLVTFTQDDADAQSFIQAILQRLGDLGWRDGRNLSIEYRWGAAERSRTQGLGCVLINRQTIYRVGLAGFNRHSRFWLCTKWPDFGIVGSRVTGQTDVIRPFCISLPPVLGRDRLCQSARSSAMLHSRQRG